MLLLKLLLLGLVTGQLFRLLLLLAHAEQWTRAPASEVVLACFDRGLLFDLYVNAWMLLLPSIMLGARHALGSKRHFPIVAARWVYTVPFVFLLLCSCADLPFYAYTNMRLNDMALSTAGTLEQTVKELVSTPPYLLALLAFGLASWVAVRSIRRLFRTMEQPERTVAPLVRIAWLLVTLLVLVIGIRGTIDFDDAPLTAEDAYFSDTPFLNQLGTNAPFSLLSSFTEEHVALMGPSLAMEHARSYLDLKDQRYTSPIARDVTFSAAPRDRNVVLILVESLSAERLHRFGHPKVLMPFLEQLMDSSLVFDRFFSAGTRTCNGIFSTLYGLPALGEQHPLAHPSMTSQPFYGLPHILREAGYGTFFFYPGDPRFDNMNGFLPSNGFDRFVTQNDFPPEVPRNSWGVTDRALYTRVLSDLDTLPAPFFATIMTISSHKGYNVPDDIPGFAPTSDASDENIYEYADRALADFFAAARKEPWYDSTLFVVLGDHGQRFDPVYEVPLAYHHVPLIVHAPGLVEPRTEHGFGSQPDVPSTVLALLRLPHTNNMLGRDLLSAPAPLTYFGSDARLCAIDERYYWIRSGEVERLYEHGARSTTDLTAAQPSRARDLRTHAMGMVQTAQWLVDHKLVGKPVPETSGAP